MRQGISTRQALVLIRDAVGWQVAGNKLLRAIAALEREGRMSDGYLADRLLYPEDVDRLAGEIWRWRAPWWQRRNVKGDYDAWVEVEAGRWMLLRLPYERTWNQTTKQEDTSIPDKVDVWPWPTGVIAGALVRVDDLDGLPTYAQVLGDVSGDNEA